MSLKVLRNNATAARLGGTLTGRIKLLWRLLVRQIYAKLGYVLPSETLTLFFRGRSFSLFLDEHPEDVWSLADIFVHEEYRTNAQDPRIIVDAGANIGLASIYFTLCFPKATIYSIEADPITFKRLSRNVAQFPNIVPIHAALGSRDGEAVFYHGTSALSSSLQHRYDGDEQCVVPALSFASLKQRFNFSRVDILKFDIEGGEEVLCRDTTALADSNYIVGEVHTDLITLPIDVFLDLFQGRKLEKRWLSTTRLLLRTLS